MARPTGPPSRFDQFELAGAAFERADDPHACLRQPSNDDLLPGWYDDWVVIYERARLLRESAQRTLIRIHLRDGNYDAALRDYRDFRDRLNRELGIAASGKTLASYGLF